jgi:leucyl/phenylalanyl-tRNA---protein transferase
VLTPELLVQAYLSGSFPMADPEEGNMIYWHTPKVRGLLPLDERFKVPKNLRRLYRKGVFDLRINTAFAEVIELCSQRLDDDTWISDEIKQVYIEMQQQGLAHSFEAWLDGELVGGLYGVAFGKVFFGESMFHRVRDASKVTLVFMVEFLREQGFQMVDCQYLNPHLLQFGAYELSQEDYLSKLDEILNLSSR